MALFDRKITWEKLGLVIAPQSDLWWMQSHAMIPTLDMLGDGLLRVFFSGRNVRNVSHTGWAAIDLPRPTETMVYSGKHARMAGALGCFDDHGVARSSVVTHDAKMSSSARKQA